MKFTDEFDHDILHYAFRYALGRRSYAVGIVIDELKRNRGNLHQYQKAQIKDEIRKAIQIWDDYQTSDGFPYMPKDIVQNWSEVLGWSS